MNWKYFILAIFGMCIPVATVFHFRFNLLYPLMISSAYVFLTVALSYAQKDKRGRRVIARFALAGFLVAAGFSALVPLTSTTFFFHLQDFILYVCPSAVYWMNIDTANMPELPDLIIIYAKTISLNMLLYAIYGCVFFYYGKLLVKSRRRRG